MLKKSFGKRLTSGIVSAAMLMTAAGTTLSGLALTASAGQQLGMTDFNEGVGLPWHTCVTPPASLDFSLTNGAYKVTVVNNGGTDVGGESRWDCQLRHRKLTIVSGHSYTVKWEVTLDTSKATGSADNSIYTKIGNLAGDVEVWHNNSTGSGDFGSTWDPVKLSEGKNSYEVTFTADKDVEVAEWAFHFGGAGQHQNNDCMPNGAVLTFDNLSLIDNTSNTNDWEVRYPTKVLPEYSVHGNQVGYYTNLEKKATYHTGTGAYLKKNGKTEGSGISAGTFYVINASTKAKAYTGTYSASNSIDPDSGYYTSVLDFTDLNTPGTYYISMDGTSQDSYTFEISDTLYDGVVEDALNYFYQNRAGVAISDSYITSTGENSSKSALAHSQYGHNPDTAYIQNTWIRAYLSDGSDVQKTNGSITANHGWYDAGDHGKYVVNGGIAVWTLLNLYEWTLNENNKSAADKFSDSSSSITVPEKGNSIPDILDEVKVELEFFKEMMVKSSYNYSMTYNVYADSLAEDKIIGADTKKYENMVFHKLHDSKWTGLAVHAWDYQTNGDWEGIQRIVKPPSTAATLNAAATFAQASRLFEAYDSSYASELLTNAKACYEAAKLNPELYAPLDQAIGGGAYGDDQVDDDFYWAACELYATTGAANYKTDLETYGAKIGQKYNLVSSLDGGENSGSFTSFNWGNTGGLGTLSLYLNGIEASTIGSSIVSVADAYIAKETSQGFGVPYQGTKFTDPVNLGPGVEVTGYEWGSNSMIVNNAIVMAYAYMESGNTKYLNGAAEAMDYIFGRNAMDFSYVTGYGDEHCVNPHHRFWSHELDVDYPYAPSGVMSGGPNAGLQDPYVRGLGYTIGSVPTQICYVDSVEAWSVNEVTINWNAPFAWMMSFLEDEADASPSNNDEETDWGNADCSTGATYADRVVLADAILMAKAISGTSTLSTQGRLNADVEFDGTLNSTDLNKLLGYIAGKVNYADFGKVTMK